MQNIAQDYILGKLGKADFRTKFGSLIPNMNSNFNNNVNINNGSPIISDNQHSSQTDAPTANDPSSSQPLPTDTSPDIRLVSQPDPILGVKL